jgi:hypothetical protein
MTRAQRTFDRFLADLGSILGSNLYDVIIHGSFVLGDFRPNRGDLDYIVVTRADLDEETNGALFELHDRYRSAKRLLLHQLEGTFYPRRVLRSPTSRFVGCYIGTGRRGWRTITSFQNSAMDLRIAGELGKHLLGRDVPMYRPSESDIRQEQRRDLASLTGAARRRRNGDMGFWVSLVHWCARTIYYLEHGQPASKSQACDWCRKAARGSGFDELFKLAEHRRHPYGQAAVGQGTRTLCRALLRHVCDLLSERAEPRTEEPWTPKRDR